MPRAQACWMMPFRPVPRRGVDEDRVDALRDQVRDLLRLLRDVVAGVVDGALDLRLVGRHPAGGLEDVLHLDPPLVADERVGERDLERLRGYAHAVERERSSRRSRQARAFTPATTRRNFLITSCTSSDAGFCPRPSSAAAVQVLSKTQLTPRVNLPAAIAVGRRGPVMDPGACRCSTVRVVRILVTGGAGMIGGKLAQRLARDGSLGGEPVAHLLLADVVEPEQRLDAGFEVETVVADLARPGVAGRLVSDRPDVDLPSRGRRLGRGRGRLREGVPRQPGRNAAACSTRSAGRSTATARGSSSPRRSPSSARRFPT